MSTMMMESTPSMKRFKYDDYQDQRDTIEESFSPTPPAQHMHHNHHNHEHQQFMVASHHHNSAERVSFEDRKRLNGEVMRLSPEMLADLVDVVRHYQPDTFNNPNEIEIDFETVDVGLFRTIERFVNECLQRVEPILITKKISPPRQRKEVHYRPDRVCSSCGTKSTPTWRENEGSILCNACGLRLGKLGIRCSDRSCGYVPHSSEARKPCPFCNSPFIPFSSSY